MLQTAIKETTSLVLKQINKKLVIQTQNVKEKEKFTKWCKTAFGKQISFPKIEKNM